MKHLGFDIGATHMRITELRENGIGPVLRINTPADPTEAVDAFTDLTASFGPEIETLRGGVAAIVDEEGSIVTATNLPQWNAFPFARALSQRLKASVRVRNDAELAALGEAAYGAGKEARSLAYLGVGTGVGTAFVEEGTIRAHSSDGEARAAVIALSSGGTLEERIGGRALARRFGAPAETLSRKEWDELTPLLAEGIENAMRLWEPDVIALGGSLMNEEDGFRLGDVVKALEKRVRKAHPPVALAALEDSSALYGAKAWAASASEQ